LIRIAITSYRNDCANRRRACARRNRGEDAIAETAVASVEGTLLVAGTLSLEVAADGLKPRVGGIARSSKRAHSTSWDTWLAYRNNGTDGRGARGGGLCGRKSENRRESEDGGTHCGRFIDW
jgi:hypothetical protein